MVTLLKAKVKFLTLWDADGHGVASNNHGEAVFSMKESLSTVEIVFLVFAAFTQSLQWICSCLLS